jgi:hypothetical protein
LGIFKEDKREVGSMLFKSRIKDLLNMLRIVKSSAGLGFFFILVALSAASTARVERGLKASGPVSSYTRKTSEAATARQPYFHTFAPLGPLDTDLSAAYAYPVPYRAELGHREITFAGLGQDTRVEIYTLGGEKVAELESGLNDGQLPWSVTNSLGEDVASGVYVYLLQSGRNKKTGKLVIIR